MPPRSAARKVLNMFDARAHASHKPVTRALHARCHGYHRKERTNTWLGAALQRLLHMLLVAAKRANSFRPCFSRTRARRAA